jgi:hypothetical protein
MSTIISADTQAILDQISRMHMFYADNWYHLLVFLAIAATLIGAVIPILLNYWQNRQFRSAEEAAGKHNDAALKAMQAALTEQATKQSADLMLALDTKMAKVKENLQTELAKQLQSLKADVSKQTFRCEAISFGIQAHMREEQQNWIVAIDSAINSATSFHKADDFYNFEVSFNTIMRCLQHPRITVADLSGPRTIEDKLTRLAQLLQADNPDGRYSRKLEELAQAIHTIKNPPPAAAPQ